MKKIQPAFAFLFALALAAALAPAIASAASPILSAEKALKTTDISAGGSAEIMLNFDNPFGRELPIKIQDKNVLGGNGMDIQCIEYTLPAQKTVSLSYPAVQAFQSGTFTLDKAKITYINPETEKEETIESQTLAVAVKPSASAQNMQQQGITTIYQCDGVSMQSTSYSSSSSMQTGSQQQQSPSSQTQDKLNSMQQGNQNMQSVKQEMEAQALAEAATKQDMAQKVESSPEFKQAESELQSQGYQRTDKSMNPPENANTGEKNADNGSFEYQYKNQNGETASIKGDVNNGSIENLQKWSASDAEALQKSIENDSRFQALNQSLAEQGYRLQNASVAPQGSAANATTFQYSYTNPANNMTAQITGNAILPGNITKIALEKTGENKRNLTLLLALAALLAIAYVYFKRRKPKQAPILPAAPAKPEAARKKPDFRSVALGMLDEAEKMFLAGEKKESYFKVSEAVRYYFMHKFEKSEMTSSDALKFVRDAGMDAKYVRDTRECFSICDLVKFAKYEPNEKDFGKVCGLARKVIGR